MKHSALRLLFALVLLDPVRAIAHQDVISKPKSIEMVFDKIGVVRFILKEGSLAAFSLTSEKSSSAVSREDLVGIGLLQLDTLEVRSGEYFSGGLEGVEYHYVCFRFGSEEEKQFGEYPEVAFAFHDGEYSHRTIERKVSADEWQESMSVKPSLWKGRKNAPNQPPQHNAGSRPSSSNPSAFETPSSLGPRG
jgi:hypothetical protein